jgi:hypothetical protein
MKYAANQPNDYETTSTVIFTLPRAEILLSAALYRSNTRPQKKREEETVGN